MAELAQKAKIWMSARKLRMEFAENNSNSRPEVNAKLNLYLLLY